jgi:hypothetical protein
MIERYTVRFMFVYIINPIYNYNQSPKLWKTVGDSFFKFKHVKDLQDQDSKMTVP